MANPLPTIHFIGESGRESIQGEPTETLFQLVEKNWHNLSGANLRRFLGNRIDLCDAYLPGADCYSSDFTCARLLRAKMKGTCLYGAALAGADLQEADLTNADLYRSDLRQADLRGAKLAGANLERASLVDADLHGATYSSATKFPADFVPTKPELGLICEDSQEGINDEVSLFHEAAASVAAV